MVQWGYDQVMSKNTPLHTTDWSYDIADCVCHAEAERKMAADEEDTGEQRGD